MLNALSLTLLYALQGGAAVPIESTPEAESVEEVAAPLLDAVFFEGREYFKDTTIRRFLSHQLDAALDESVIESDRARVEQRYHERGFLEATVAYRIDVGKTPLTRSVVYIIDAKKRADLKEVSFNGQKKMAEDELAKGLFSREPQPFGFLTRAGFFHKPYLDQDGQRIVANFYRFGFLEARVLSTRVKAWPALNGLSVAFDVYEGSQYEIASIEFQGELLESQDPKAMREKITLKDGELADLITLQTQSQALLDPLREEGYAFARFDQGVVVAPAPSGRDDRKGVSIILKAVRGPIATVRNINIVGNKTQERVIRRDITIKPGERYKHSTLVESQRELMRTGFYRQAILRPVPTEDPALVDIEVQIAENQTFIFSVQPFFARNEGWVGLGVIADRNLFGTGLSASANVQISLIRQLFDFSLSEPRLLGSRVALSTEVHRRELFYRDFRLRTEFGGGVRARFPLLDSLKHRLFFSTGLTVEWGGVVPLDGTELAIQKLLPQGQFRNVVDLGISYDRRDSALRPRNGLFASATSAYTGAFTLAGVDALDTRVNLRLYYTPFWQITLKSNTQVGLVVNPTGDDVPVTDRRFLGGASRVRGYFPRSIGPKRRVDVSGVPTEVLVGGTRSVIQSLELEFPLWPGLPFRGFFFGDAGNTFDDDEALFSDVNRDTINPLPLGLFTSVGGGVLIDIAIPLRLEWSVPLTRRAFDRDYDFLLGIGSSF